MEDLGRFLRSVEQAQRPVAALRAQGTLNSSASPTPLADDIVIVLQNADTYVALRKSGLRAILPASPKESHWRPARGERAQHFGAAERLAGSDFTREDLQPFATARFGEPRIADHSVRHITVMLVPQASQYSLIVITFDRDKRVPLKTLYYQETVNNLVKMRRDSDHVLVGTHWLPRTITMEHFQLRTTSSLRLDWSHAAALPPDLFDPDSLGRPSRLEWATPGQTSQHTPAPAP